MTMIIERFIICNGNGCDESYGVDFRGRTSVMQRKHAKINGWTVRLGRDLCPECSKLTKTH